MCGFSSDHVFQVHEKTYIFNKNICKVSGSATPSFQILGGDCNLFKISWHIFCVTFQHFFDQKGPTCFGCGSPTRATNIKNLNCFIFESGAGVFPICVYYYGEIISGNT